MPAPCLKGPLRQPGDLAYPGVTLLSEVTAPQYPRGETDLGRLDTQPPGRVAVGVIRSPA